MFMTGYHLVLLFRSWMKKSVVKKFPLFDNGYFEKKSGMSGIFVMGGGRGSSSMKAKDQRPG